jgi:acyl-coenzyme A synthetase/AMP-(fatty) acid ligase
MPQELPVVDGDVAGREKMKRDIGEGYYRQCLGKALSKKYEIMDLEHYRDSNDGRIDRTSIGGCDSIYGIYRTGGTTGPSKSIVFDNGGINGEFAIYKNYNYDGFNMHPGVDSLLCETPPMHFTGDSTQRLQVVNMGVQVSINPYFGIENSLSAIRANRPTSLMMSPSQYNAVANNPSIEPNELAYINTAYSGAEKLFRANALALTKKLGRAGIRDIINAGGASETGSTTYMGIPGSLQKVRMLDGTDKKIFDEDGKEVSEKGRGELYIATPAMFREYLGEPERTHAAFWIDQETGKKYWRSHDIVESDGEWFDVLGRGGDSFVSPKGKRLYYFDTKGSVINENYELIEDNGVEFTAIKTDSGKVIGQAGHVVLNEENRSNMDAFKKIMADTNRVNPNAEIIFYDLRDGFSVNKTSHKRDTEVLTTTQDGFNVDDNGSLIHVHVDNDGNVVRKTVMVET